MKLSLKSGTEKIDDWEQESPPQVLVLVVVFSFTEVSGTSDTIVGCSIMTGLTYVVN